MILLEINSEIFIGFTPIGDIDQGQHSEIMYCIVSNEFVWLKDIQSFAFLNMTKYEVLRCTK